MDRRLFIHIKWGGAIDPLCQNNSDDIEYYFNVNVSGKIITNFTKSDFIWVPKGTHNLMITFYYGRTSAPEKAFVTVLGKEILVEDADVHLTIKATFLNDNSVNLLDGNVEYDLSEMKPQGCYIATAVYENYDCPQVWTLRRFRDDILGKTWYGRAFIKSYYAISPSLVRTFGQKAIFKKIFKKPLDNLVQKLQKQGIPDTPYIDKDWSK